MSSGYDLDHIEYNYNDDNDDDGYIDDTMLDSTTSDETSKLLEHASSSLRDRAGKGNIVAFEDALKACGFGKFHVGLLLLCGWAVSSDAIEVLSISFILPSATCDLSLNSNDKGFLSAIVFVGMLIGGYIWGSLADKLGRRSVLVWSLLVNSIGNVASSFSQTFWLFLIFRIVSGIGVGGSMPVIFTYFTEFQHKDVRGSRISLLATFWMGGNLIVAGLAWIIVPRESLSFQTSDFTYHSWRVFIALCSLPALTSATAFVLMPESPKFLLQSGRPSDAIAVLQKVHATNKSTKPLKIDTLILTQDDGFELSTDSDDQEKKSSCDGLRTILRSTARLFNRQLRRRTLSLLVINFTLAFGYYGLFMWFPELFQRMDKNGGSFCEPGTQNMSGNNTSTVCENPSNAVFFQSFLTSISNLPGNLFTFFLVEKIGRKSILAGSMSLSGLSVFGLYFVAKPWQNVLMSCIFGAISVCGFNMLDILMVELFPTEVRSTAFGVQTCATRVGAILGNFIFGALVDVHCAVPMILVAVLLIFGGICSLLLPNTTKIDIH